MDRYKIVKNDKTSTNERLKDAEKILFSIRSDSNPSYLVKLVEEYKKNGRKK